MSDRGRRRLLVYFPTWLGDGVMVTPALPSLRRVFPVEAWSVTGYVPRALRGLFKPMAGVDRWLGWRKAGSSLGGVWSEACFLRRGRFDAALLMPNSFRAAAVVSLAGIPKRMGYSRDGRGWLLTDRVMPRREAGRWVPEPAVDYYMRLVRELGGLEETGTPPLRLDVSDAQRAELRERLGALGLSAEQRLVVLNPGASKVIKRWPAERYAELADRLTERLGVAVAVSGSPAEREILTAVQASARARLLNLAEARLPVRLLKAVLERADLLVTNDTGPRHVAAAVGTSVVTLFGPTGPEWTVIPFDRDVHVLAEDRGTMGAISVDVVFEAAERLLTNGGE
ncbi:glycosyltransferase family 9 protein [Mucisphaera calidilacus]|uniref:ADP-heptose--LPS heptosyltransferase 2 n=1 Tax=Mucisphaera calidilacus TaxID=2527982 RepID=A0A518BXN5_9BACT|nr:glycosyltransferase family 9 protein [Mucisphaera calidilacus]QDU71742.1 ADP-heptose--LPS heptosyltransferase 2 [Mucisphaera calidilacus]